MQQKQFKAGNADTTFTAKLGGTTGRTVLITRDDQPDHLFLTLDPVDHDVARELLKMPDDEFLDMAVRQAIEDDLINKALESGGPVVALLKH